MFWRISSLFVNKFILKFIYMYFKDKPSTVFLPILTDGPIVNKINIVFDVKIKH